MLLRGGASSPKWCRKGSYKTSRCASISEHSREKASMVSFRYFLGSVHAAMVSWLPTYVRPLQVLPVVHFYNELRALEIILFFLFNTTHKALGYSIENCSEMASALKRNHLNKLLENVPRQPIYVPYKYCAEFYLHSNGFVAEQPIILNYTR